MIWNRWLTGASVSAIITGLLATGLLWKFNATQLFQRTLLPALILQVAMAGYGLWQLAREKGRPDSDGLRTIGWMALVSLVATAWIAGGVPAEFRVLADETNLLGSALSMSLSGGIDNITQGTFFYDTYHVLEAGAPARPLLFPAATAVAHLATGYSAYNGFGVNLIACFLTLMAMAEAGRRLGSLPLGLAAAGLLAGHPLFELYVRASGFEAVNLMMMSWTLVAMIALAARATPLRFELALWLAALAGQCRYESVVLLGPVVLLAWLHRRTLLEQPWGRRLWLLPATLVPLMWQRRTTSVINPGDKITNPFGLQHVPEHLRNAIEFFFDPHLTDLPISLPFSVLAVAGAAWAVSRISRWRSRPEVGAFALFSLGILVIFATHMAYYLGDLRAPFITRYALSYLTPLALLAALPLTAVMRHAGGRYAVTFLLCLHLMSSVVRAAENTHGSKLTLFREYKETLSALRDLPMGRVLLAADRPGLYAAHRYSAIKISRLNSEAERYLGDLERHLYDDILVIQHVTYRGKAEPALSDAFEVTPLREFQNTGDYFVRLSRVRRRPQAAAAVETKPVIKAETPATDDKKPDAARSVPAKEPIATATASGSAEPASETAKP